MSKGVTDAHGYVMNEGLYSSFLKLLSSYNDTHDYPSSSS